MPTIDELKEAIDRGETVQVELTETVAIRVYRSTYTQRYTVFSSDLANEKKNSKQRYATWASVKEALGEHAEHTGWLVV